jgi:cysteamine dioxygenase
LNWDYFLAGIEKTATMQHQPSWDQEAHVAKIGTLAQRLNLSDLSLRKVIGGYYDPHHPGKPEFKDLANKASFQITLISFEKGEMIPLHDHPDMTGVICCVTGQVEISSYELLSRHSSGQFCLIKHVANQALAPGQISTLTTARANVHCVRASSFCQVIDIFSPPYTDERVRRTHWYSIQPGQVGNDPRLSYATVRGGS